jgi:molybdopterin converting factor small subunit
MQIELRLYATLRQAAPEAPTGVLTVDVPAGATVADLFARFNIDPADVRMIMINGIAAEPGRVLQGGDRLGLFPPLGGG